MKTIQKLIFTGVGIAMLSAFTAVRAQTTEQRYVENALVTSSKPAQTTQDVSVIMVPGHNLSTYIYSETPDGRDGWATMFVDEGYEVHLINDPTFDFSRDPNVPKDGQPAQDPNAFKPWDSDIWSRWGFGPREGTPYDDARFPTDDFDVFEDNYPWVGTTKRNFQSSIVALLEDVGPAILIAHSAGGPQAVNAAMERPDLVAAIVLVEPTGPPTAANFPTLEGKAMLGVYGDYIASRRQQGRKDATTAAAELFTQNGGHGEILDLVEDYGIRGNSHLMMQGNNNDDIAEMMIDWLDQHADSTPTGKPGGGMAGGGKGGKGGGKGGKGGGRMGAIFARLDANSDGSLDKDEFGDSPSYEDANSREVREAFEAMDKNEDDKISSEEFSSGVTGGRKGGKGGKGGKRGG